MVTGVLFVLLAVPIRADLIWPDRFNLTVQFEVLQRAGCSGFCALNGFGDGVVIGTAPICKSSCATDCPGKACIAPIPGGTKGFMPDGGDICLNMPVEVAEKVFSNEPLAEKFKDILMVDGKSCCCETPLPMEKSETKQEPTPKGTVSCDDWCQSGGFGHGVTVGTAPACGASCASDCPGNACTTSNNFFSDHGSGCATGDKVCCCAAHAAEGAADWWKRVHDHFVPPPKLPSSMSCADFCNSGGSGGGRVIGTAPSCGASCSGDCAGRKCVTVSEGDVTDYGHGCWSGDKVCCCDGSEAIV